MKKVIAIPTLAVKKAGAKILNFNSVTEAAKYFDTRKEVVVRSIKRDDKCRKRKYLPFSGYYFDYLEDGE